MVKCADCFPKPGRAKKLRLVDMAGWSKHCLPSVILFEPASCDADASAVHWSWKSLDMPVDHGLCYCRSWPCPPGYPSPLPHLRQSSLKAALVNGQHRICPLGPYSNTVINSVWCPTQPDGPSASGRRRWRSDVGSGEGPGLASAVIRAVHVVTSKWLLRPC